ncbi:MAG: NYN domain-containing protein [Candidatus Omnitrophica bacterium]|nr:NYN domain-containing protein [Candidatus Omnitrophota bacterium]
MSLHYVIDGYNVINHPSYNRIPKLSKDYQKALLEFITVNKLCGSPRNRITVVFDGFPAVSDSGLKVTEASIIFSEQDSADSVIKRLVEDSRQPKNIQVISDDRELCLSVRLSGGCVLGVEEFISRKQKVLDKKKTYLSSAEIKPELNRIEILKINQELERKWLK